jgi:hypothetical protein
MSGTPRIETGSRLTGRLAAKDCTVTYRQSGRKLAVLTIGRDCDSLAAGTEGSNRLSSSGESIANLFEPEVSYGRPVGCDRSDGSVLVADDVGDVIWRVTGKRQG